MTTPSDGPFAEEDTRDATAGALAAEHAAIWSYGLASAFLDPVAGGTATAAAEVHRARRDGLQAALAAAGIAPAPAAAAYAVPAPVTDAVSAAGLLATAEDDTAAAWRGLLERTDDPDLRRRGVAAVGEAATTGVGWRRLAGTTPLVDPFPGTPRA